MLRLHKPIFAQTGGNLAGFGFIAPLKNSLILDRGTGSPTFTRADGADRRATVVDYEGRNIAVKAGEARFSGCVRYENLLSLTENWSGAGWTHTGVTATGSVADPNGGTAAFTLTATGSGPTVVSYRTITSVVGNTYANSCWIRRRTGTGAVNLRTINNADVDISGVLTSSWKRFTTGAVSATGTTGYFVIGIPTTSDAIDVAFPQTENVTGQSNQNPGPYVSVGVLSAPYHGAGVDGVQYFTTENGNTVASNVVTEATGAAIADATLKGYLAEGSRQNRCLYSNVLENAAWTASNVTVDDDSAVAPDGTTTAATLTATAGNGTVIQDLGVVGSAAKAGGFYIKRKTGTGNIDLTLDNGSTWTTKTVTAAWTRIEITQTLTNEDFGIRIVTSGDAVYVWNGQVETASFLSSTVTTTSAAVTRAADVLTYPTSGNFSGATGTFYCESSGKGWADAGLTYEVFSADGLDNTFSKTGGGANTPHIYDGTGYRGPGPTITSPSSTNKLACTWGGAACQIATNGSVSAALTFDGLLTTGAALHIGCLTSGSNNVFGNIRNVRISQSAVSDARLVSMTS